jgi:hypothetical protein
LTSSQTARLPRIIRPSLRPRRGAWPQPRSEELNRLGVTVELDKAGKAHFHATRIPRPAARLTIERQGDLIEAYLIERAIAALKREQESGG